MPKTTTRPRVEFEPERPYSTAEVADKLNTSQRQIRQWFYDGRFADDSVIELPRGLRIYGWALNELLAEWTR